MEIVYLNPKNRRYVEGSRKRKAAPFAGKRKSKHGSGSPALNRAAWDNLARCAKNNAQTNLNSVFRYELESRREQTPVLYFVLFLFLACFAVTALNGYLLFFTSQDRESTVFLFLFLLAMVGIDIFFGIVAKYVILSFRYEVHAGPLLDHVGQGTSIIGTVTGIDRTTITYEFTPPGGDPLSGVFKTTTAPEINVGDQVAVLYISDAVHILL